MIVQRLTFPVKPGTSDKVVEMIKEGDKMHEAPHGRRIYTSYVGTFNVVVQELEFENLAEMEAYWAEWFSLPETAVFMERWTALADTGGGNDVWTLVE